MKNYSRNETIYKPLQRLLHLLLIKLIQVIPIDKFRKVTGFRGKDQKFIRRK